MKISFREWEDSACLRRAAALLDTNEIQEWIGTTPFDHAGLTALINLLSPEECRRAEWFSVSEPRHEFMVGRALPRQLSGACLNVEPATLTFGYRLAVSSF